MKCSLSTNYNESLSSGIMSTSKMKESLFELFKISDTFTSGGDCYISYVWSEVPNLPEFKDAGFILRYFEDAHPCEEDDSVTIKLTHLGAQALEEYFDLEKTQ